MIKYIDRKLPSITDVGKNADYNMGIKKIETKISNTGSLIKNMITMQK